MATYTRFAFVSDRGIVPVTGFVSGPKLEDGAANAINRFLKNSQKASARVVMRPMTTMWIVAGFVWFVAFGLFFEGGRECFIDRTQGVIGLRGPKYRTFGPRVFPTEEVERFVVTSVKIKKATLYGLAMRLSTGEEIPIINGSSASDQEKKKAIANALNNFHQRAVSEGCQQRALDV